MKLDEFQRARLELTAWYILISVALLTIFSVAAIGAEQRAFGRIALFSSPGFRPRFITFTERPDIEQRVSDFELNFRRELLLFDLILLLGASGASYFLSGLTLRPIQEMVRKQQEFSADASHELRTPLTTIGMEIEALKRTEKKLPSKYRDALESIQEEVDRMKVLVEGLLTLVRTDKKSVWKRVNLGSISEAAADKVKALAKEKNIKLNLKVKDKIIVLGDEEKLSQVIIILLDNAIKYSPKGSEVKLEVSSNGSSLIEIADQGIGIPEKELTSIFERFYRVKDNHQKGSGLGLAIAKKVIEEHGGKISVESQVNQGSKFSVKLPLV